MILFSKNSVFVCKQRFNITHCFFWPSDDENVFKKKFKTRSDPKLHPKNPGPYEQLMNTFISYIFVISLLHVVKTMEVKRSIELKQQFMFDFTFNIIYDTLQYVDIIRIWVHHIHSLIFALSCYATSYKK